MEGARERRKKPGGPRHGKRRTGREISEHLLDLKQREEGRGNWRCIWDGESRLVAYTMVTQRG